MSSHKESNSATPNNEHVQLSDEETVEQYGLGDGEEKQIGRKRKNSSKSHDHFKDVDVKENGATVKKRACNHCGKQYVPGAGGSTTTLNRHLLACDIFQRLQRKKKDVKTRWNSTHRMLESAIHYKRAFQGYALRDSNFEWCPIEIEWTRAEKVCKLLQVFLVATNLFSGSSYPTANLFLIQIFKVKKEITNAFTSDDTFLENMSVPMYEKFDKYWGEIGVLMSIASILDPRFKKESVTWTFKRLYAIDEVDIRCDDVIFKLKSLFQKYSKAFMVAREASSSLIPTTTNGDDDFFAYLKSKPVENSQKTELDVYLEEPNYMCLDNEFDVLKWWSQNCSKFPILSKMARDIFCIPITTVASESAFSAGGAHIE